MIRSVLVKDLVRCAVTCRNTQFSSREIRAGGHATCTRATLQRAAKRLSILATPYPSHTPRRLKVPYEHGPLSKEKEFELALTLVFF